MHNIFNLSHLGMKLISFCVAAGVVIALLIAGGVFTNKEAATATVNGGRAAGFGTSLAAVGVVSWAQGIGDGFRYSSSARKAADKKAAKAEKAAIKSGN